MGRRWPACRQSSPAGVPRACPIPWSDVVCLLRRARRRDHADRRALPGRIVGTPRVPGRSASSAISIRPSSTAPDVRPTRGVDRAGRLPNVALLAGPARSHHRIANASAAADGAVRCRKSQLIFAAYRDRLRAIAREGRYGYAMIFKNSGRDAGMSREHLHSQLVALPELPPIARQEQSGAERFMAAIRPVRLLFPA